MQTGKVKGISGRHVWIEMSRPIDLNLEAEVELKKYSPRRSQNANRYFHVLCEELRKALRISSAACKNMLITSYGQLEYLDDEPVTITTNVPADMMQEQEVLHCRPIGVDGDNFIYQVYRGSHTYNTREMALLIDGTIEECKLQGIETMTPDELKRLEGYG